MSSDFNLDLYYVLIPRKCPYKTLFQHTLGGGVKFGQNYWRIILKNCKNGRGGCQNSGKIADVVLRWSQSQKAQDSIVGLKIL